MASASVLSACAAGITQNAHKYELKAGISAEQLHSDVETTGQVVRLYLDGRGLGPWASVTVMNAEKSVSGVDAAFMSRQPPTPASDRLRDELGDLLDRTEQLVSETRIALRRGDVEALHRLEARLAELSPKLDEFAKTHL